MGWRTLVFSRRVTVPVARQAERNRSGVARKSAVTKIATVRSWHIFGLRIAAVLLWGIAPPVAFSQPFTLPNPDVWTSNCGGCHSTPPGNEQTINGAASASVIIAAIRKGSGGMNSAALIALADAVGTPTINTLAGYLSGWTQTQSISVPFSTAVDVNISHLRLSANSASTVKGVINATTATPPTSGTATLQSATTAEAPVTYRYTHTAQTCTADSFKVNGTGPAQGGVTPTTSDRTVTVNIVAPSAPTTNATSPTIPYSTSPSVNLISLGATGAVSNITITGGPATGTLTRSGSTITYAASATAYTPSFSFTYTVTGPCGDLSAPRTVTVSVGAPPVPSIAATATANAPFNLPFSYQITATNAATYSIPPATLPAGLSLNTSTGVISGTPTVPGSTIVTVTVANANGVTATQTLTININLGTPVVNSPATATGALLTPFSYQITATNLPTIFTAAPLPLGLTLSPTGLISGTPTLASVTPYLITITAANATFTSAPFTLTVNIPASPPVVTGGSTTATVGVPFTFQIAATNAPTNYTATPLPAWLSLNSLTGVLTGTPPSAGSVVLSINATNGVLPNPTPVTLTITVSVGAPVITSASAGGTIGQPLSYQIPATNSPTSYTAAPLPPGLSLNGTTGVISGTPTAIGSFIVTLTATNATGTGNGSVTFVIANVPPPPLPNAIALNATATFNTAVQVNLALGVSGLFTSVTLAGQATNGSVTLNGTVATYTPRVGFFGTDSFTYTATGPGGTTAPVAVSITVAPPPAPVGASATLVTPFNTAGTIDLAKLSTGVFTTIAIAAQPTNGAVSLSGNLATYTPNPGFFGTDSFTFTVTGPGGTSAPSTVSITVTALPPVANPLNFILPLNTPTTLDLAPFITGSAISGVTVVTAPAHGTVTVNGTKITFTPAQDYFGADTFTYAAFGVIGTSTPATVRVTITGRPDPTKQAAVTGLVASQIETAERFAKTQISNFQSRMESLHRGEESPAPAKSGSTDKGTGVARAPVTPDAATGTALEPTAATLQANFLHGSVAAASTPTSAGTAFPFSSELATFLSARAVNIASAAATATGGASGATPSGYSPSFWIAGTANFGSKQGNPNRATLDFTTNGVSLGVDRRFSEQLVLGIGAGFGRDRVDIGGDGSRNKADGYALVGYSSYQPSARTFVDTLIGIGSLDFSTRRYVKPVDAFATGDRRGQQVFGSVAAGYEYRNNGILISPYGRIDFSSDKLNETSESGAGQYALTYFGQTAKSLQGVVGVRAESLQPTSFGAATPRLRLEYRHEFQGARDASVGYADLPGGPRFAFTNPVIARTQLALGLGTDFIRRDGIKLGFDYEVTHAFNKDKNQSLRLNFTKDLDGRGAPFAASASSLEPTKPTDIQVEFGYTFDDNVTRAKEARGKLVDRTTNVSAGKGITFKFDGSENEFLQKVRAVVTISAAAEQFQNFDGLSRATAGLQGEVMYRTSADFDAPTFALTAQTTGEYTRSELRRGTRASLGLSMRQALTDRINYLVGVTHQERFAKSNVFSARDNGVRIGGDYALSAQEAIYLSGEFKRGHFFATGQPSLENLAIADVFVVDDAFPARGLFSYRTRGNTFLSTIGYNLGFGERQSLDFSWRRAQSKPNERPSFVTSPSSYIVDQYSIVYLIRF